MDSAPSSPARTRPPGVSHPPFADWPLAEGISDCRCAPLGSFHLPKPPSKTKSPGAPHQRPRALEERPAPFRGEEGRARPLRCEPIIGYNRWSSRPIALSAASPAGACRTPFRDPVRGAVQVALPALRLFPGRRAPKTLRAKPSSRQATRLSAEPPRGHFIASSLRGRQRYPERRAGLFPVALKPAGRNAFTGCPLTGRLFGRARRGRAETGNVTAPPCGGVRPGK